MPEGQDPIGAARESSALAHPLDADLAELHRLWQAKRRGRTLPARVDFDPREFRRLLPSILLLDILPPPDFYRVRLSGEGVNSFYGRNIAGLTPREYMGADAAAAVGGIVATILATRQPVFRTGRTYWQSDKSFKRFENCMLPLSKDDTSVDMLLVAIKFG